MNGHYDNPGADGAAFGSADGSAGARRPIAATPYAEHGYRVRAAQHHVQCRGSKSRLNINTHTCSHPRRPGGRAVHRGGHPDAGPWFRLLDRDRRLLSILAEHKVLTTDQIAALEFTSTRRAQDRLRKLREMGMLFAFRESLYGGGTSQTQHALGYLGARLIAATRAEKPPAQGAHALMLERLACSPTLAHRLGVNDFFCALAAHRNPARHRDTANPEPVAGLTHWWSERQCTDCFRLDLYSGETVRLRPDGYGCWEQNDHAVRFFLEYDTGTESLTALTGKLATYQRFPTNEFGILLFSLHSSRRETALHRAISGYLPDITIATVARDHMHPDGPAGPVWALWTPQSDAAAQRLHLADLPERGPRIAHHTGTSQPYNEAAFDPNAPDIRAVLDSNCARSGVTHPIASTDRSEQIIIETDF
ncbi:replication-relaxation family protein [Nocardia sp. NBC_01503]|uniref:replication-relaxation family protein n=1 Tax=Nocardia sp. NBC_01503 TaxID=2975997 RepID=UPI002E7B7AE1|nr:replication-relaxation family protein [Nocardia sp. NBC_01503]WTL29241.1 replication-relaxation family protein [Nocardia sp. NBC_01503]